MAGEQAVCCAQRVPRRDLPPTAPPRGDGRWLGDAVADLLTGSRCVGCATPGALLCTRCRDGLPTRAGPAVLDPWPRGLGPVWSAGPHAGVLRALVVGHKEESQLVLRAPLAALLALAVADGCAAVRHGAPVPGPLLLCPVPSRPGAARRRGHDPLGAVVARAARVLRRWGHDAHVADLLRQAPGVRGVRDQGELGAEGRATNVAGTLFCPTARLDRTARRHPHGRVVLCDDVVTTGATLQESSRALRAVGVPVLVAATITTTPRRSTPGRPGFPADSRARSLPPVGGTH